LSDGSNNRDERTYENVQLWMEAEAGDITTPLMIPLLQM
jgi:hypothetical protein